MPRVLIVDDDRGFRSLLTRLCEEEGCGSVAVGTAEEALYSLENHAFDLAIIDLHLPGKSGAELAWFSRE